MDIIAYTMPEFSYRQPQVNITANGELSMTESGDAEAYRIPKSIFLFSVIRDADTHTIIKFHGLDHVNAYLMYRSVNHEAKDTKPIAKALLCYHQFLADNDLKWDHFPVRNHQKPTYQFKRYLEELHGTRKLALSTAKAYISQVVRFYKFYLSRREFTNKPFNYEVVTVKNRGSHSSISASRDIIIETTDLRLKIAGPHQKVPNKLRSLSEEDWYILNKVLNEDRCGIRLLNDKIIKVSLAIEFTLIFLVMRYTGLRRKEALTLPVQLIYSSGSDKGFTDIHVSPAVGVQTKNGSAREIEIPRKLLILLYEYKCTERFLTRSNKFMKLYPNEKHIPLFLNRYGEPFDIDTVNARWGEIRRYICHEYNLDFSHKPHNLRATYGTFRMRDLIMGENPVPVSKAQVFIQFHMGHKDLSTTEIYLDQLKLQPQDFSLVEEAINFHIENYKR